MKRLAAGFTLFEVLVALAIMAVALAALLRASGVAADNSELMKQRMQATWAAQNHIALLQARREWPAAGGSNGEQSEEGGRVLRWQQEVSETPNPLFRKVIVRMLAPTAEPYVLAEVSGFVRNPVVLP